LAVVAIVGGVAAGGALVALIATGEAKEALLCIEGAASAGLVADVASALADPEFTTDNTSQANTRLQALSIAGGRIVACVVVDLWRDWQARHAKAAVAAAGLPPATLKAPELIAPNAAAWLVQQGIQIPDPPDAGSSCPCRTTGPGCDLEQLGGCQLPDAG
jgi:hypothetical protein